MDCRIGTLSLAIKLMRSDVQHISKANSIIVLCLNLGVRSVLPSKS